MEGGNIALKLFSVCKQKCCFGVSAFLSLACIHSVVCMMSAYEVKRSPIKLQVLKAINLHKKAAASFLLVRL